VSGDLAARRVWKHLGLTLTNRVCNLPAKKHLNGMKKITIVSCVLLLIITACSTSKTAMHAQAVAEKYGKDEQIADTFLHRLQQENDLVLANAVEHTAWGHNITYRVIARKGGQWKGYNYKVLNAKGGQVQINETSVNASDCNSVLPFFEKEGIWKERTEGENKCGAVINDGSTWHLLLITPAKVLRSTWYEPAFYQQHCPDSTRQMFLDAFEKVKVVLGGSPAGVNN